ncbi:hypothetical protein Verru16b_00186 [Lacunisphaera limnophila]|uniref:Lipoprotein n=1 Tax=Lacunisphaera limnophila TaxID=1838286 RepID=A0A1I7PHQ4_9BACT|nr:hypothetical protein [Lacunisphaera limnophila]AOS43145.1 hypothetical protein Verru16b_00186 [Lacunisphaera limnophila]
MKNKTLLTTTLLATGCAALLFAGCAKNDREEVADKSKEVYQDTKTAVAAGWNNLKDFTFEKRNDFTATLKARQADLEAGMSKLRSEYSEANASASRKAAMAELKDSEANYKDKLAAVGNASADTWTAARDDVAAAWDRLQASYAKARAGE